jgi:lambda repressor-like predicted transcriptional regulator
MDVRKLREHIAESMAAGSQADHAPSTETSFDQSSFGAAVRNLRAERGWSLRELSKRSNISQSALSRVETGQSTLSFDRAHALAHALGVDAMQFVQHMGWPEQTADQFKGWRSFTPKGEGRHVTQPYADYEYVCGEFLYRRMIAGIVRITARSLAEHGPMVSHPGEEFVYVIEGSVIFATAGYAEVTLKSGDCMQYDSSVPHAWYCTSKKEARVLFNTTDPRST